MLTGQVFGKARLGHPALVLRCGIVFARSVAIIKNSEPDVTAPARAAHLSRCFRRFYRMSSKCQAFVGEKTKAAEEYHSADFDFLEHKAAVDEQLARNPSAYYTAEGVGPKKQPIVAEEEAWEAFHARDNATARFYKERRYLLLEFPVLTVQNPPQHVVELGCGCGSALLPILKENPCARVTATDISPTAVRLFETAALHAGIAPERVRAFACNSADASSGESLLTGLEADSLLIIFTLAALPPKDQHTMLSNAFKALKPGGRLLIRDHGVYDITQLRLRPEQKVAESLYKRGDGTLCYFFSTEDLTAKAQSARFACEECSYVCVQLLNRRKNFLMRRIFVHGVFRKPEA